MTVGKKSRKKLESKDQNKENYQEEISTGKISIEEQVNIFASIIADIVLHNMKQPKKHENEKSPQKFSGELF